jgi:tRNA (adenine57-N1/adenine58-N1)-methyltransferase
VIPHDQLIGQPYGSQVRTHLDALFYLLTPSFEDILAHARHSTTIIQPKDLGIIAVRLGIQSGSKVIEAGTGSGGLTTWLGLLVGDTGRIYSYDRRESNIEVATRNLTRAGVLERVTFQVRDIAEGFDETNVDAVFLDVTNPWDYLSVARAALRGGGHFGALIPTMNQAIQLVSDLYAGSWFRVEVVEIWERTYKVIPARLRPEDRMIGHTGYLVFARAVHRLLEDIPTAALDVGEEPSGEG